jgi:hypothetical protein
MDFSFVILWSTWFQITIFDVRFAGDSVFERICKFYQFTFFTMLAVVGFTFAPGGKDSVKAYRIYQTLAIVMGISRYFLAIQYAVVGAFVCRKYKKLIWPFLIIIMVLLGSGSSLLAVGDPIHTLFPQSHANELTDISLLQQNRRNEDSLCLVDRATT